MPHFKLRPCEFDKWSRFDSWPIEQAAFILTGAEPPPLDYLRHTRYYDMSGPSFTWDEPPGYRDLLSLLENSIANGVLEAARIYVEQYVTQQVRPGVLMDWAKRKNLNLPDELFQKIPAAARCSDPSLDPAPDEERLGERERTTVRKIIAGLLMHGFNKGELSQPYGVAGEIQRSLHSVGLDLSDETIARWVKEANEVIAENENKPRK